MYDFLNKFSLASFHASISTQNHRRTMENNETSLVFIQSQLHPFVLYGCIDVCIFEIFMYFENLLNFKTFGVCYADKSFIYRQLLVTFH